jgi:putative oxidoreductase
MFTSLQNPLSLIGRALLALLFVPAGFGKIAGFAGTAGYIASKGVPLPEVAAGIAIAVELGLGLMLLAGFKARWAALGIALFTVVIDGKRET